MLLSQYKITASKCVLVYAEPKIGKSHFAASAIAVAKKKWLMISDRNGLDTYFGAEVEKAFPGFNLDNCELQIIERDKSIKDARAFDRVREVCNEWLEKPDKSDQIEGIIIEDSSFLRRAARNLAVAANGAAGRSNTLSNMQAGKFKEHAMWTEGDFGKEMEFVYTFFDDLTAACRQAGKHLIVLAHEAQIYIKKKNDKNQEVNTLDKITAAFTGKKEPTANSAHFDIVIRLTRKGKEANMKVVAQCKAGTIANGAMVDAGDRTGTLQTFEENLTWGKIMDKVSKRQPATEPVSSKKDSLSNTTSAATNSLPEKS